jgi:hypothetical protein
MKKKALYFLTFLIAIFSVAKSEAACEIGPILFRDTLYGTAVGTGVGALVLLSTSNSSNIAPTLATSALIGAGVGLIVGVVELSYSDCSFGGGGGGKSHRKRDDSYDSYGFNLKPLITIVDTKVNEPSLQATPQNFGFNKMGGGLTFEFPINSF